jgi:predicted RNA-binding protein with PIN domain
MPVAYLVDGYNLIFALGFFDRRAGARALEQARRRLVDFLSASFVAESVTVTVVFDAGHSAARGPDPHGTDGVRVHFASGGEDADDVIERLIAACTDPHRLVVISNDHRIQEAARRKGARPWTCDDFLDHRERSATPTAAPTPHTDADRRTPSREEIRRWLDEFRDVADSPEARELFDPFPFEDDETTQARRPKPEGESSSPRGQNSSDPEGSKTRPRAWKWHHVTVSQGRRRGPGSS